MGDIIQRIRGGVQGHDGERTRLNTDLDSKVGRHKREGR
jgi:hypothetical protein